MVDYDYESECYERQNQSYFKVSKILCSSIENDFANIITNFMEKHLLNKKLHPENAGWFFLTHQRQAEEMGLKVHTVRKYKNMMLEMGVLEHRMFGIPKKEWFRINFHELLKLFPSTPNLGGIDPMETMGQDPTNLGGIDPPKSTQLPPLGSGVYKEIIAKENIIKKPKKGIFKDAIIKKFQEVFPDYIITNWGKEMKGAGGIYKIWQDLNPNFTEEQILTSLGEHFRKCRNINNSFHRQNMSLTWMVTNYNQINNVLKEGNNPRKQLSSRQDLSDMNYDQKPNDL